MKLTHAVLIFILSIVVQASFVRLFVTFPFAPNLALIGLFISCYFLTFERILILAIIAGIALDLSSSVSFGSTMAAALGACSLNFFLKENILTGGRLMDFFLGNLIAFFFFYFLLDRANIFLNYLAVYAAQLEIWNINLAGEILFNSALSAFLHYLARYYKRGNIYGFNGNIKISS